MSDRHVALPSPAARVCAGIIVAVTLAFTAVAADDGLPLSHYLQRLRTALARQAAGKGPPTELTARVTAESRSGVRRLRIRDFQFISDSNRSFAGYNLGAGSWETQVGVLGSAVATEFLVQAASAGIDLESLDVVFTSHQDPPSAARTAGQVNYPRNLRYEAYIVSPASEAQLEALRLRVEASSPVLNLVSQRQDIPHGRLAYTQSPAAADAGAPPGLREFLIEKRAALLRRQRGDGPRESPTLRAHVRVEGGTGLRHVRVGDHRFQFLHDTARTLAGFDLGPTVEEHQLGVMGTCLTHIFEIQAAQRQVPLDGLEVEVKGTLTARTNGEGARLRDVRYTVFITSPAAAGEIDGLRQAVESVCPIYNLLKDPQAISGRVIRQRFEPKLADSTTAAR
jgi:uncharacterized OsmC-like protein